MKLIDLQDDKCPISILEIYCDSDPETVNYLKDLFTYDIYQLTAGCGDKVYLRPITFDNVSHVNFIYENSGLNDQHTIIKIDILKAQRW